MEEQTNYVAQIKDAAIDFIFTAGPSVLLAILTLVIGSYVIGLLSRTMKKAMVRSNVDESLRGFLNSLLRFLLWVVLIISVATTLGVETTSFVAILGAAGLAIGLALQGSLSNFAGGVLILLFKPFRVGDVIDTQGVVGTVKKIDILHTIIYTPDNREVILPNGPVANSNTVNITSLPTRRVDFAVGIAYDADIKQAREVILNVFKNDSRVLADPAPAVRLTNLGDSSLDLSARVWVNTPDYWDVYWENLETIKEELDKAGIGIPFPQRDVHIISQPK